MVTTFNYIVRQLVLNGDSLIIKKVIETLSKGMVLNLKKVWHEDGMGSFSQIFF